MKPKQTLVVALTILFLTTSIPANAERSEDGRYIAGEGVTIWCGPDSHPLVPQGDPQDHDTPEAWLFSGEPECAFNDALNTLEGESRAGAYGGYGWAWEEGDHFPVGDAFTVTTIDDVFGTGNSYVHLFHDTPTVDRNEVEGCGTQTLVLEPYMNPWMTGWPALVWIAVPPVGTEADLTVCFASKGLVESRLTPA